MTTWGIVTTVKANAKTIMTWVAYHLEAGADEIQLYLDTPCPRAEQALAGHPKVKVILCDEKYWRRRRPLEEHQRPPMHQARQFANAKWAYMHTKLDWLIHIDIDEFLWPETPVAGQLAALPDSALCARIRPLEALSSEGQNTPEGVTYFKSAALPWDQRKEETRHIYPMYGPFLNGGFLSHLAGKMAVRTGIEEMMVRIHNVELDGTLNPGEQDLTGLTLCHMHAHSWDHWRKLLDYRARKGSYRKELAPPVAPPGTKPLEDAMNMHDLFKMLLDEGGEEALRAFFDEVCLATPELRERLARYGHLAERRLDLDAKRLKVFGPDWA